MFCLYFPATNCTKWRPMGLFPDHHTGKFIYRHLKIRDFLLNHLSLALFTFSCNEMQKMRTFVYTNILYLFIYLEFCAITQLHWKSSSQVTKSISGMIILNAGMKIIYVLFHVSCIRKGEERWILNYYWLLKMAALQFYKAIQLLDKRSWKQLTRNVLVSS